MSGLKPKQLSLYQMVDLALPSENCSVINFQVLHSLLHVLVKQANLDNYFVEFDKTVKPNVDDPVWSLAPRQPRIEITEYKIDESHNGQNKELVNVAKLKHNKRILSIGKCKSFGESDSKPNEKPKSNTILVPVESNNQNRNDDDVSSVQSRLRYFEERLKDLNERIDAIEISNKKVKKVSSMFAESSKQCTPNKKMQVIIGEYEVDRNKAECPTKIVTSASSRSNVSKYTASNAPVSSSRASELKLNTPTPSKSLITKAASSKSIASNDSIAKSTIDKSPSSKSNVKVSTPKASELQLNTPTSSKSMITQKVSSKPIINTSTFTTSITITQTSSQTIVDTLTQSHLSEAMPSCKQTILKSSTSNMRESLEEERLLDIQDLSAENRETEKNTVNRSHNLSEIISSQSQSEHIPKSKSMNVKFSNMNQTKSHSDFEINAPSRVNQSLSKESIQKFLNLDNDMRILEQQEHTNKLTDLSGGKVKNDTSDNKSHTITEYKKQREHVTKGSDQFIKPLTLNNTSLHKSQESVIKSQGVTPKTSNLNGPKEAIRKTESKDNKNVKMKPSDHDKLAKSKESLSPLNAASIHKSQESIIRSRNNTPSVSRINVPINPREMIKKSPREDIRIVENGSNDNIGHTISKDSTRIRKSQREFIINVGDKIMSLSALDDGSLHRSQESITRTPNVTPTSSHFNDNPINSDALIPKGQTEDINNADNDTQDQFNDFVASGIPSDEKDPNDNIQTEHIQETTSVAPAPKQSKTPINKLEPKSRNSNIPQSVRLTTSNANQSIVKPLTKLSQTLLRKENELLERFKVSEKQIKDIRKYIELRPANYTIIENGVQERFKALEDQIKEMRSKVERRLAHGTNQKIRKVKCVSCLTKCTQKCVESADDVLVRRGFSPKLMKQNNQNK